MTKTEIAQLVIFIIVELVGFIPVGIWALVNHTTEDKTDPALKLTTNYMVRSLLINIICIPLFIFLADKRLYVALILFVGQIANTILFRHRR